MKLKRLGQTEIQVAPVVFGGNVFGWTVDEKTSFDLLDRFVEAGFNAIDTADSYTRSKAGNVGGESETIIGNWLKSRGTRDKIVIITKVGSDMGSGKRDLSAAYIEKAIDESLRRLQTDYVDLYLSHWPDPTVPYTEPLTGYQRLIEKGKIRACGASNLDAEQMRDALAAAAEHALPRYDVLEPSYNLCDRTTFEGPLRDLCIEQEIGVITYYSLARGFLTGKYRSAADFGSSPRGSGMSRYLDARGLRILDALDRVSAQHEAQPAEIALAWAMGRPGVSAPIASATSLRQLESLVRSANISLNEKNFAELNQASEPDPK